MQFKSELARADLIVQSPCLKTGLILRRLNKGAHVLDMSSCTTQIQMREFMSGWDVELVDDDSSVESALKVLLKERAGTIP